MTEFRSIHEDAHLKMTGNEMFPVIGGWPDALLLVPTLMQKCKGLNPFWDCLQKAIIVEQHILNTGVVMLGSCHVYNDTMDATYGYDFNLPTEFHAWWQPDEYSKFIIDIALPGVISKGMLVIDEQGPLITGRLPVILAGKAPNWVEYIPHMRYRL